MKNFFVVDISVFHGNIFIGHVTDSGVQLEPVRDFSVSAIPVLNHKYWGIYSIYLEIIEALKMVAERGIKIESIGITTTGSDVCCFSVDGKLLSHPYALFDDMTDGIVDKFFSKRNKSDVYRINGMQSLKSLTIFQLEAMRRLGDTTLNSASKLLFLSDALNYLLTGQLCTERTIAGSSGLLNVREGDFDSWLMKNLGLSSRVFPRIVDPGTQVGFLSPELQQITGLRDIPVVAVGYNLMSSLVAAPAPKGNFGFLVLDSISLVGLESDAHCITDKSEREEVCNQPSIAGRFSIHKYTAGDHLLERCVKEFGEHGLSQDDIQMLARSASGPQGIFSVDSDEFEKASSLVRAVRSFFARTLQPEPADLASMLRCIMESLCYRYSEVFARVQDCSEIDVDGFYLLGRHGNNTFFSQLLANAIKRPVVVAANNSPAVGNVMVQALAAGVANDIWDLRGLQAKSPDLAVFYPRR